VTRFIATAHKPGGYNEDFLRFSRDWLISTGDFNAIDPSIIRTQAGELWMAFGSYWSGLKLVPLDPATGLRLDPQTGPVPLAWSKEIEAAQVQSVAIFYPVTDLTDMTGSSKYAGKGQPPKSFLKACWQEPFDLPRRKVTSEALSPILHLSESRLTR